jgi:hypothetical protein
LIYVPFSWREGKKGLIYIDKIIHVLYSYPERIDSILIRRSMYTILKFATFLFSSAFPRRKGV